MKYTYHLFLVKPSAVQNAPPRIEEMDKNFESQHLFVPGEILAHPDKEVFLQVVQRIYNPQKSTSKVSHFELQLVETPAANRINHSKINENTEPELYRL